MDKFQQACKEYYLASGEIKRLTKELGDISTECVRAQNNGADFGINSTNHLEKAYELCSDDEGNRDYVTGEEPAFYLNRECPHCLRAHNIIQERKQARQRLGYAKRRISQLGRAI